MTEKISHWVYNPDTHEEFFGENTGKGLKQVRWQPFTVDTLLNKSVKMQFPDGIAHLNFSDFQGFIYKITRFDPKTLVEDKFYIGKKNFWSEAKRPLTKKELASGLGTSLRLKDSKGRKCIREKHMTDWYKYCSSSEKVKADIALLGKERFRFEILEFCLTPIQMTYYEESHLYQWDAMLLPEEQCYNDAIRKGLTREQLKICVV